MKVQLLQHSGGGGGMKDVRTCVYQISIVALVELLTVLLIFSTVAMSAVCLLSAESQVRNTDFKATVLNFVRFLFRIKIAIIAVFGAR